jgi:predicted ATPase
MTITYNSYPKGSEWRKWDLQTQTILDDNYISLDKYYEEIKTVNPAEWQAYIGKVGGEENALLYDSKAYFNNESIVKNERCVNYVRNFFAFLDVFNPELECIGITDHNYFDDCLLDTFIDFAKQSRCKIIPGVEINCQGIHMLLFFPHNLYQKETFSSGIHAFLMKFNINNRTNVAGVLTTTTADIKDILDEVRKNSGIIVYPHCNSNNGLFQERTATDRTHLADIFNHQKINLLQSQQYKSSIAISDYIKTNNTLASKFCSHISSDARSLKDFGQCDQDNNFLWIKADPTFEGLKQITYESEQRIFVGTQKPEEKKSYFVIDKVRFLDNTSDAKFGSDPIEVNQNLTTIIGGKSTGKSLLLYYIAKTIDSQEVKNRTADSGVPVKYDFDSSVDFNFEVTWRDGQRTLLRVPKGTAEDESKDRKILYIPQKYLNTLSEANIKSREALNEFVLNVILQDSVIREKHDETIQEIKFKTKSIPTEISELFSDREDIKKTEEELKQAGDEKGIESYIKTLQKQVDIIKKKSGLSAEQLKQYEDLVEDEKGINTKISNLEEDKKTIKSLNASLASQVNDMRATADECEAYLNDVDVKAKFQVELKVVDSLAPNLKSATANIIAIIDSKIKIHNAELVKIKAGLAPLFAKVKLQSELQEKTDAIKGEQQKLNEISIKHNNLKTKKSSYKKKADSVVNSYKQIIAKYESLRNEFKKFESKFGEITLGVHVSFNDDIFNSDVVKEYINKNDLKRVIVEAEWGDEFIYKYDPAKHLANIMTVFDGLVDGTINTVKGRQTKDAIIKLLENYFFLDFRIFYKNDSLDKMSPGKKGLVLLQLLINLSNGEWPILLDQPEDDLDNRSVYDDLVDFLKKKKIQRQIIIVTHNPNLVVGADAEETIVANQSGQEVGRENKKFRFEYVSGALENAFELDPAQEPAILYRKGVRQHVCEILEGGKEAFQKREQKYDFKE